MSKTVANKHLVAPIVIDQHGNVKSDPPVTIQMVADQPHAGFWQAAMDWQGLEGGGLAIVAALITGKYIVNQTKKSQTIEDDRVARQLRALRAVLPLALSNLADWADACGDVLLKARSRAGGVGVSKAALGTMPLLSNDILAQLQGFVEAADTKGAESVANLLANIQIFTARMRNAGFLPGGYAAKNQVVNDLDSHLLGIGAIAAHVATLFDYSRRRSEETPALPGWDGVRTSLKLIGADPLTEPSLFQRLDAREARKAGPGYLCSQ